jgi:uncharacterized membrane protein (DUF2068 family)
MAAPEHRHHDHHHHVHHKHPIPEAVDERTSTAGLRTVATIEIVKGTVVLLLALGLLTLLHKDVEDAAETLLDNLHIGPDRHISRVLMEAASGMTDRRIWAISGAALAYTTVRYIEGWGLWHRRVWAEWFALLSGALYLPIEILKMVEKPTWFRTLVFVTNLIIVLYMLYVRVADQHRLRVKARLEEEAELEAEES